MISVIANGYNNMRIGIAKKMILVKPTLAIKKETIVKIKAYVLQLKELGYNSLNVVEQAVIRPMEVFKQAIVTVRANRI